VHVQFIKFVSNRFLVIMSITGRTLALALRDSQRPTDAELRDALGMIPPQPDGFDQKLVAEVCFLLAGRDSVPLGDRRNYAVRAFAAYAALGLDEAYRRLADAAASEEQPGIPGTPYVPQAGGCTDEQSSQPMPELAGLEAYAPVLAGVEGIPDLMHEGVVAYRVGRKLGLGHQGSGDPP
jgi:hypothetical protein